MGSRADKDAVGIVARVIYIEGIADTQIQLEGVQLGDRPKGIDGQLWVYNKIALLVSRYRNGPKRARNQGGGVFRQVNIVVVLKA